MAYKQEIATLERRNAELLAALEGVVTGSFYGDPTGYFHVTPAAFATARAAIANNSTP